MRQLDHLRLPRDVYVNCILSCRLLIECEICSGNRSPDVSDSSALIPRVSANAIQGPLDALRLAPSWISELDMISPVRLAPFAHLPPTDPFLPIGS